MNKAAFLGVILFLSGCAVTPRESSVMAHTVLAHQNSAIQNIVTDCTAFWAETESLAGALFAEAEARYEAYMPALEEALTAYRENKDFTVSYAAYDRYFYFDYFSLPEGTITILSRDNTCMGFRMNLRCREAFDGGITRSVIDVHDREFLCEYYEIGDLRYFSYADSDEHDAVFSIPNFMCMTGLEDFYAIDEESVSYTVYRQTLDSGEAFFGEAEVKEPIWEYVEVDGRLYRIDREHNALFPVNASGQALPSGTPASADYVYQSWMKSQKTLCQNLLYEMAVSKEDVEAVLPEGYMLRWSDYTAGDINGDGISDILAVICPVLEHYDYEGRSYYGQYSPYLKVPEYYYQELWLFAGGPDGNFTGERLLDWDSVVWDDTFILADIKGFSGGFFMEYFVGRSPFKTVLFKITYENGEWKPVKQYENDSYSIPTGFYAYTAETLAAEEMHDVSVEDYVNERYETLLMARYHDYDSLFRLPDEALAEHINEILKEEMDKLFGAMEALDEYHDVLLLNDFIFQNSRVAVLEFRFRGDEDGIGVFRSLSVNIDLQTGDIIDFRDYITAEEIRELLDCTYLSCQTGINPALFDRYDDYETLLKAGGDSMTLLLVHEGLLIIDAKENGYLIPRCRLLSSPLAAFWDDWQ